ncbi:MAG TPA: hypothetical protein VNY05_23745 [Candidatus Acidoferrales bacterium]|nr:hypothetical protein [Candidatus Acidoferrales bacterium]
MTVTLDLPPIVEQAYLAEARATGVPLNELMREVLIAGQPALHVTETVFEQGLGLFGGPEDAALLDEVVAIAYEERRAPPARPQRSSQTGNGLGIA